MELFETYFFWFGQVLAVSWIKMLVVTLLEKVHMKHTCGTHDTWMGLNESSTPCMNLAWVSPSMHEPYMGLPFHSWTLHGSPLPCMNLSWVSTSMHEPCMGLPFHAWTLHGSPLLRMNFAWDGSSIPCKCDECIYCACIHYIYITAHACIYLCYPYLHT